MFIRNFVSKSSIILGTVVCFAGSALAGGIITNCKPGYVALTYDDGPNVYTSDLVNLLDSNGVKATFFVNGDNFLQLNESEVAQEAIKKAYNSNHQIASHTWSHKDLDEAVRNGEFDSELVKLEQVIQSLIGVKPAFIRPPYGNANEDTVQKLNDKGYEVIIWSTDTKDYLTHDLSSEMELVRESFSRANKDDGFIILSHDVYEQTATTLTTALIQYVREEGFNFCTVAECVGSSPYK